MTKMKERSQKIKGLPFSRFIPSLITLSALAIGMTSILFALQGKFENAILAVLIASVLDAADGRVARLLGSTSRFGAELDSLADFCNFGIAPSLIFYLFALKNIENIGWIVSILFAISMVLRLARFNTLLEEDENTYPRIFFMGTPAPASALLALLPIVITFQMGPTFLVSPTFYCLYLTFVSILVVSKVPTFSFKGGHIPHKFIRPIFILVAFLIAGLVVKTWLMITIIGLGYLGLMPFSIASFQKYKKSLKDQAQSS